MGFPSNPNLPKPPPKSPPPRVPGAPPAPPVHAASVPPTPPSGRHEARVLPTPPQPHLSSKPVATASAPNHGGPLVLPGGAAKSSIAVQARVSIPGLPADVAQMVEAVDIYDSLLAEENGMLKSGDSKGVAAILDRKIAATQLYQERLRTCLSNKAALSSLSPDQRQRMVTIVKGMEARAKENTLLLKANMSAIEHLIEAVNTAARKMRRREVAYSGTGRIRETYSPMGVSMAFNRTI